MDTINTDVGGSMAGTGITPRSIQPSGFLLGLSEEWRVDYASANVGAFLGIEVAALIGSAASTFLSDNAIHALRNRLALLREPDGIERLFACQLGDDGPPFDVAVHMAGEQVILEAEPSTAKLYGDVTGTLRGMMARVETANDLPAVCEAAARQMRALTGFDRVIVTRLQRDGRGTIIAEAARGSIDTLPGAQISKVLLAAEELAAACQTSLHVITDVDAESVQIVGGSQGGDDGLDLGCAVLRSGSSDQLDRLRSFGARASVTVALEVDGALWGLISCHHNAPRRISFERRALVELFAQMFAMRIEIVELKSASRSGSAPPA